MAKNKGLKEQTFKAKNLIKFVDKETLTKLGQLVKESYERDFTSASRWRKKRAKWLELFMQYVDKKTFPWEGCSNVPVPILTTAAVNFQARAYEALMPVEEKVKVNWTGSEDVAKAERVQKHMNYQLNTEMDDYEGDWDISLFQLCLNGSIFRKIYYDNVKKMNVAEYCSAEDVIVPYKSRPNRTPRRITHILDMTMSDINIRKKAGIFQNVDDLEGGSSTAVEMQGEIKNSNERIEGQDNNYEEVSDVNTPRILLEQHLWYDMDDDGIDEPYVVTVDKETERVIRIISRRYIDSEGIEHVIDYFEHYYFFINPEGYYGLGFGHMLGGLTEAAKALLDQIIDAGTMANLSGKSGFVNTRSGIKTGDLKFRLGKYTSVDIDTDDIRKAIYNFDFPGPNTVLYSVLGLIQDYSDRVSTVSEIQTGEMPRSDTSATAFAAAIEQGMKVFSAIHKRIYRAMKKEFKKIYMLNGIYVDNKKYIEVLGINYVKKYLQAGIPINGRKDYTGFIDIQPVADPRIISRTEKVALAEQVLTKVLENPATANDPQIRRAAYEGFYKTIGVPNYEIYLERDQRPPDLPQTEENAMMINEKEVHALPQQEHLIHKGIIEEFKESMFYEEMTPMGKRLVDIHDREHIAFLYQMSAGRLGGEE